MALKYLYVPSGTKAGTAYGVLPNSANADFDDFSRSSAGSRVDKNGLINTGLGLGSEEVVNGGFSSDSNWTKGAGWTIANGVAINQGNDGSQQILQTGVVSADKSYEMTITVVSNEGTGNNTIYIGNKIVSNTNLGVGTYTFQATPTSGSTINIFCSTGGEFSIDNVSVREITEVNTDVPRLDYTGGGCPSLLLEPTSTNYVEYSEDFSQSPWTKINSTITSNTGISPDGSQNADRVYFNGTFNAALREEITTTNTNVYTFSIWIKKISANYTSNDKARIEAFGSGTVGILLLGDALNSAEVGESVRYSVTTSASTGGTSYFQFRSDEEATFEVWGAQVEPLSYATSYIPNYGTSAGVTRSQDVGGSTGDISSVVNSKEGTFMIEAAYLDSVLNRISLNNAATTTQNRITILADNTRFNVIYRVNNVGGSGLIFTSELYENSKIAVRWKNGSITGYLNGTEEFTATNIGEFPTGTLDRVTLGISNESHHFKGRVKQLRVYDEYLSDAEMAQLTTL